MVLIIRLFQNDQQLIESIRRNDDAALAFLYEKNLRMVMKFIIENSGTESDAKGLLQDALVVLWEKVRQKDFMLNAKLSTFIYGIVKNLWLKELARRKRFVDLDTLQTEPQVSDGQDVQLEKEELTSIVKNCMTQLSELCQKVLIAFYFEELSMQEIGKKLGLANEDVAKSKNYQCKKELERLVIEASQ